jgi:hypothetical protein
VVSKYKNSSNELTSLFKWCQFFVISCKIEISFGVFDESRIYVGTIGADGKIDELKLVAVVG